MTEPVLRLRAELRGSRIRLIVYTVGLPTAYRSEAILRRELQDWGWAKLVRRRP